MSEYLANSVGQFNSSSSKATKDRRVASGSSCVPVYTLAETARDSPHISVHFRHAYNIRIQPNHSSNVGVLRLNES